MWFSMSGESTRVVTADIRSAPLICTNLSRNIWKDVRCINMSHRHKSPRERERSTDEVTVFNSAEHFHNTTAIYLQLSPLLRS